MFDVFISHDTSDYELALTIHGTLHKVGISAYIYELYPQYRKDISTAIRDVLKTCKVCLCLLTYNGVQSFWVHQELGAAYAFDRVVIPAVQLGVDYKVKGFVQFRPHINYDPTNLERFTYDVIWALRNEVFGHQARLGLRLQCPNGHESNKYILPSTEEINEIIQRRVQPGYISCFVFECDTCKTQFKVSPWTFEEVP